MQYVLVFLEDYCAAALLGYVIMVMWIFGTISVNVSIGVLLLNRFFQASALLTAMVISRLILARCRTRLLVDIFGVLQ